MEEFRFESFFKLLIQNLAFLSLILMAILLYFSNKLSKEKENIYLIIGLVLMFINASFQMYIFSHNIDYKSELLKYSNTYFAVVGSFAYKLLIFGILYYLLKFEILKNDVKRENLFLIIIYSLLTLGYYAPYWFMKKDLKFNGNFKFLIILQIFFLSCMQVIYYNLLGSDFDSLEINKILYIVGSIGYFIVMLVLLFSLKNILMKYLKNTNISDVGVFFLGVLYLQYKLNQYIQLHHKKEKQNEDNILPNQN